MGSGFQAGFEGFALGLSLILAIGAQNAFVLRQGIRGEHVAAVVAVCVLSDFALIALGVAGFGALSEAVPWLAPAMRWGGAAFLIGYGATSFRSAWRGGEVLAAADGPGQGLGAAVATCLALTWLNPHVYIDTLMLVGSVASTYGADRALFGLGAAAASLLFFPLLGYGARGLAPVFAQPVAWRVLDVVVGATMWVIAAGLVLGG